MKFVVRSEHFKLLSKKTLALNYSPAKEKIEWYSFDFTMKKKNDEPSV